jgi:hypothetical protein
LQQRRKVNFGQVFIHAKSADQRAQQAHMELRLWVFTHGKTAGGILETSRRSTGILVRFPIFELIMRERLVYFEFLSPEEGRGDTDKTCTSACRDFGKSNIIRCEE